MLPGRLAGTKEARRLARRQKKDADIFVAQPGGLILVFFKLNPVTLIGRGYFLYLRSSLLITSPKGSSLAQSFDRIHVAHHRGRLHPASGAIPASALHTERECVGQSVARTQDLTARIDATDSQT